MIGPYLKGSIVLEKGVRVVLTSNLYLKKGQKYIDVQVGKLKITVPVIIDVQPDPVLSTDQQIRMSIEASIVHELTQKQLLSREVENGITHEQESSLVSRSTLQGPEKEN